MWVRGKDPSQIMHGDLVKITMDQKFGRIHDVYINGSKLNNASNIEFEGPFMDRIHEITITLSNPDVNLVDVSGDIIQKIRRI